ncbi:MAG: SGNH/GDSL hydrolase family protein [Polyangiaceae bacterium]|nr:SGNH/GDSL hydrolase family protein [Myxococcales bacterium]
MFRLTSAIWGAVVLTVVQGCGSNDASPATAGSAGSDGIAGGAGGTAVGATGPGGTAGTSSGAGGHAGTAATGGFGGLAGENNYGGAAGAAGSAGSTGHHPDLGVGPGTDVVLIGDSWMNLGLSGIQQSVVKSSGNRPYRQLGVPGTRLLDNVIPTQYELAKAADPSIMTVLMTGGGNDILQDPLVLADCFNVGDLCKSKIDAIGERYIELFDEFATDGVKDVVIVVYTRGTALGPGAIDYVWATLGPKCDHAPLPCTLVDPDEINGGPLKTRDGIHPTDAGYDLIGAYLYDLMVSEGMRR